MEPRPGTLRSIGRYLVLGEAAAGDGGDAGRTLLGLDPYLGRRITLVLHPAEADGGRARLRDARAAARLLHPNVLAIHDAGPCDAGIYVAQEYAPGGTLADWLAQQAGAGTGRRAARAILERFRQVGAGLLSAHAAGLVHGRLTAAGVLVGCDGAPRLAGLRGAEPAAVQRDRQDFCAAVLHALAQGPGERHAPRRLRRLLRAGVQASGPELGVVVAALGARRGRGLPIAAAAAVAVVLGGLGLLWFRERAAVCGGGAQQLGELFPAAQQAAVARVLSAAGRPDAGAPLQSLVGAFRARWLDAHRTACADTRLHGTQSEADMELRLGCLHERAAALRAALGTLESAAPGPGASDPSQGAAVGAALGAVHAASELHGCADLPELRASYPQPRDRARRPQIAALRDELTVSRVLHDAGRYRQARARGEAAVARARAAGFPPVLAEALFFLASAQRSAGDARAAEAALTESVAVAEAARHDGLAVLGLCSLMHVVGVQQGRIAEGLELSRYAEAALRRCPVCASNWGQWHRQLGTLLLMTGDYDGALAHYRQIPAAQAALQPGHVDLDNNLGLAYLGLGRLDEARAAFERSLRTREARLGPEHPALITVLDSLVGVLLRLPPARPPSDADADDALMRLAQRTLTLSERSLGPEHPARGQVLITYGQVLAARGRAGEAEAFMRRGLHTMEQALGPTHPGRIAGLTALGQLLLRTDRPAEARAALEQAHALATRHGRRDQAALLEALGQARARAPAPGRTPAP